MQHISSTTIASLNQLSSKQNLAISSSNVRIITVTSSERPIHTVHCSFGRGHRVPHCMYWQKRFSHLRTMRVRFLAQGNNSNSNLMELHIKPGTCNHQANAQTTVQCCLLPWCLYLPYIYVLEDISTYNNLIIFL